MKKLRRSRHDRIFAGIIGGLGEYFGVDPVILRLGWLLIVIFTGVAPGIIAYLIGIFVVPLENGSTRSEERTAERTTG